MLYVLFCLSALDPHAHRFLECVGLVADAVGDFADIIP